MEWVRIHPMIQNWPGGGPPPTFDISADEDGSVVIEFAWDPQALSAPATYTQPLRYYCTATEFNVTYTDDNGASQSLNIPAQDIRLTGNRASWTIPQALWDAYVQESLKTLRTPPTTTFSRNIYYRVRATAPGASQARIWPADIVLTGSDSSAAPHIGILPISATPSSQVVPDQAAVAAMGGIPGIPTFWSDVLMALWRNRPESDPNRQILVRIFAHQTFQGAPLATRANLLKLWLFAGPTARPKLVQLLDRNAVVGSDVVMPVISKTDLRGGKTLAENLLDLLSIQPHPDLLGITSKEQLLDDVITEILDPNGQVNQGAAATCSPTSQQTLLITVNPSEYVRLQKGWLSSSGRATLANNDTADVPAGILTISNSGITRQSFYFRTYSELAFQAAMLKYAMGSGFPALTGTPQNMNEIFQTTISRGLYADQTKRSLDALFNVNFTTHYIPASGNPADAGFLAAQTAIRDGLVRDLPGRQQQIIFGMYWGQPYQNGHAVVGIRRDGGRIYFKNPQYPGSNPPSGIVQGGNGTNPPRIYENPAQSLESISESDLATWIKGYWVPDRVLL